jgi:protein-S-isoprenylcysteine O-methyltransferase Ste14
LNWSLTAKKMRIPLGFVLAALYLAFARPVQSSLIIGGAIALVGVLARAWASGHIQKNQKLASSGPYAHTRNPLYFGSFLISVGFAIAAHWSLIVAVVAFFVLIYMPTMERERIMTGKRFPDLYPEYEKNVPAFIPRVVPWKADGQEPGEFSFDLYMKHGEWKAGLGYLGAMAWLIFRLRSGL